MMNRRRALIVAGGLPLLPGLSAAAAPEAGHAGIAERLRAGRVALLLRHSITDPGVGDPPGFRPGDCSTQRNLSAEGRAQARRIGAWFKSRGLAPARVRSSAWCRCIDTGMLAFGSAVRWEALDSFFEEGARREPQSTALRAALPDIADGRFEIWITHQVNVTALTREFVQMGEGCVIEPAGNRPRVVARFSVSA